MTAIVLMEYLGQWLPDSVYLKILYRIKMRHKLDLHNPKTFSEKLQWLKLYDRRPDYTKMVDKYAVKEFVSSIIGNEYVIPTLGVWDKPEAIDWDSLPNKFVLKTTHGGGSSGVIICRDKGTFDREKAIAMLNKSMKQDIYGFSKEWPYKNVPRRVLAEQYLEPHPDAKDLPDYKWYCFNGEPKYCQVIQNRSTEETIDFFDTEWNHQDFIGVLPYNGSNYANARVCPSRPSDLDTQIGIAKTIAKDYPFSRIDLYSLSDKTFFGEVTFYPASGFGSFKPAECDMMLGQMIKLPVK